MKKKLTEDIDPTDVRKIVKMLNSAFCDEMLAHIQYWVGAKVSTGKNKEEVDKELLQHSEEEFQHANILADRILELGGELVNHPAKMLSESNAGFDAPTNTSTESIVKQNITGEIGAVKVYKKIMEFTKDTDPKTYKLVSEITNDEVVHRDDLQKFKF